MAGGKDKEKRELGDCVMMIFHFIALLFIVIKRENLISQKGIQLQLKNYLKDTNEMKIVGKVKNHQKHY